MKNAEKRMKRDMLVTQGLCGALTLLILDNGIMFLFFFGATLVSWALLIYLTKRGKFNLSSVPLARFLIPVGSLAFAALLAVFVGR